MPEFMPLLWESLKDQISGGFTNPNLGVFIAILGTVLLLLASVVGMRTAQDIVSSVLRFLFLLPFKLLRKLFIKLFRNRGY